MYNVTYSKPSNNFVEKSLTSPILLGFNWILSCMGFNFITLFILFFQRCRCFYGELERLVYHTARVYNKYVACSWDPQGINGWNLNSVVFKLLKRINDSDIILGAHRSPETHIWSSALSKNISRSLANQWLKFDIVATFEVLKISNGSDLVSMAHNKRKKKKKGLGVHHVKTQSLYMKTSAVKSLSKISQDLQGINGWNLNQ